MGDPTQSRRLGRYQVIKHLASGGMAQVLLARTSGIEGFERYVVIKQIHVERARDKNVVKMFLDEARLAAALHHTNIVQVHDVGQEKGEYYIAMEYIHGEDLRTLLTKLSAKRAHMPLEHVVTIISSAAAALHCAHDQRGPDRQPLGIVHRDVSPANILVSYDGNVKVVDFGIAKAAHRATETHSGTLKGKIAYMAPEQCLGQEVDRRSDVFSLGIVLYELYMVRRLFKASSEFLTMSAIAAGQVPRPSLHRADIPPELEAIIMKALATSPDDRYQTADEMRLALDGLAVKLALRGSTTALADYMVAEFGRRPEPWLVDDDEAEISILDVDFDGSASGVATVGAAPAGLPTPVPGSLLARARRRAETASDATKIGGAKPPPAFDDDQVPTTASGTPMAWATRPGASTSRRWRWVALAGVGVAAAFAIAMFAMPSSESAESSAAKAPAPVVVPTPPATPPPVTETVPAPVVAPPPVAEPVPSPIVAPPPTVVEPQPPAKMTTRHAKPLVAKPASPQPDVKPDKWDPDALFLKKPKP